MHIHSRFGSKLMLTCALSMAALIAAPGAFARPYNDDYRGHSNYSQYHSSRNWHRNDHGGFGALLAGAIIGGVLVNAIDNGRPATYYGPPPPPPAGYYGNNGPGYYGDSSYGNGYYGDDGYYDGYAPAYQPPPPAPGYYYGDGGY